MLGPLHDVRNNSILHFMGPKADIVHNADTICNNLTIVKYQLELSNEKQIQPDTLNCMTCLEYFVGENVL